MGLSVSLSNALSGMRTSQSSLDVVSRNVANSGTPGYHRQSLNVIDSQGTNSTSARSGSVERAFSQSLQAYYTSATSDSGYTATRADVLDRLQTFMGKPGDTGSLDTVLASFENALQALGTSPDSYAARSTVVSQAQSLAATLNDLTLDVQGLRQEAETQIGSSVDVLNQSVSSLQKINGRLADQNADQGSRAALMDQRDRLVAQVSELIDVRADYRADGTVSLMTRSGVGILDGKASTFEFQRAGALSADKQANSDPAKSGVGQLVLRTPAGLAIDLVGQNVLRSGKLAALVELRDKTLVTAQAQLDDIAGGLAQALSTSTTKGTAASSGAQGGFDLDLSALTASGNSVSLDYSEGGLQKSLRVVRVEDATKLPLDYVDANGTRVLGLSFAGGASSVASSLGAALGSGFAVSGTGTILRVLDDGAFGTTGIDSLTGRSTPVALQNGDPALNLFVDTGNASFTGSIDGKGQALGFAGRIAVNASIVSDNTLLVRYQAGGSLGDSARADALLDGLQDMRFASGQSRTSDPGNFRLGGTVGDLIAQTMDYTGNLAASASGDDETQQLTIDTLNQRIDGEYGVNVDEEMGRLMELQNAYAANARVISVVQDLLNRLMEL